MDVSREEDLNWGEDPSESHHIATTRYACRVLYENDFFFSIKMTDVDEFEDTLDASRRSSENEVSIVNFC